MDAWLQVKRYKHRVKYFQHGIKPDGCTSSSTKHGCALEERGQKLLRFCWARKYNSYVSKPINCGQQNLFPQTSNDLTGQNSFAFLEKHQKYFTQKCPPKQYRYESFGLSTHHHALNIHYDSLNIATQQT